MSWRTSLYRALVARVVPCHFPGSLDPLRRAGVTSASPEMSTETGCVGYQPGSCTSGGPRHLRGKLLDEKAPTGVIQPISGKEAL